MPSHIDAKTLQEILQGNASLDSVNSTTPAQQNFNPIPDIASAYGGFRNTGEGGFRNTGEGGFRTVPIAPPTPPAVSDIKAQELIQNVINKSKQVGMKLSEKEQNLLSAHTALQEFDQAIAARKENQQTAIFSDDEVDTLTGKAGNLFVKLAAKTGDVFRTPLNAAARLRRGALEKGITPEQQALYQSGLEKFERRAGYNAILARLIEQPESPERNTRIADIRAKLREQILTPEEAYIFSKESARSNPEDIYQTESIGSRLDQAKQLGEFIDAGEQASQRAASRVNTKFSDKANRRLTNTSRVTAKHLEQGEYLEGIGSFLKGVKDLATEDTYAASEMIVGMVPHMIAMMYAAPVFLPSLASELNDQAIEEYKKVNNELPTDEERALIGLLSVTNASLDKLGAAATQNAAKITKSILASSTALNKKLPQTVLKGLTATGAPIGGALLEGTTEGGQNVLEQIAKTIRDPKVDPSKALVDATYGVLGGVAFASPGVASQVAEASADVAQRGLDVAQRGLDVVQRGVEAVGSTVEQALVKNTDKFIDKTKEANTPVDTQAGIERILNDGFKGLDDNATKQRITDIIGLNQKLKEFKADNPDLDVKNYDDTITTLITQFKNKELNTAVETVATNPESINEVAKAISEGADLPLKTLETVSGSTLFKDASPETKKIIEEAIQVKKSLEETARDIQDGSEDGKFKGIGQYLRDINQVNIIKDAALADQTVTALTNWEQAQQNKLDAYLNAREESVRTGSSRVEFELDGAVKYYQKGQTEKLISTIESELEVIRNTLDKAVAARNNIAETVSEAPVAPVAEIVPDTSPIQTTPPQRTAEATKAVKPRVAEDVSGSEPNISKAPEIASEAVIESKPTKTTPKAEVSSQATTEPRTVSKILAVPLTNDSVLAQEKVEALRALAKKAGKLPTELVERGKRAVRQLGRVASLKPDQLQRLDSYINNLRKDIVTYVKSKGKTAPSSSSISSPISISTPEVITPTEQVVKEEIPVKKFVPKKKKLSVNQVIRQKLTNDPKIAKDKIIALETTAKVSGNLPEAITKRLEVIKTHLGRVNTLDEDRLIRLNKAVISLATDMRANVKKPLSRAKYKGIATTLINNTNLLKNPEGRLHKFNPDEVIGTPANYNASNVFIVKDKTPEGLFNKVDNFFDGLYRSKKITKTITEIIGETTKKDRKILKSISEFHDEIKDTLKSKISFLDINEGIRPEYQKDGKQVLSALDQNPLGYLVSEVDGDRIIDENIIGLMSTVMYDWLGTRASNTLINTDDDIRSILGKDERVEITSEEREQFKYSGSVRNKVMENLGKTVVKQLGLEVGKGIDGNMLDRLAMSIGQVMIATGLEQGLLETSKVDGKTMVKYKGKNFQGDPRETTFIKLKGTANHRPTDKIVALQDTIKLNPKFINSMFSIESFQVFPTTKPSSEIPKYLKGTTQTLPEEIQKATLAKQQVKWEIKNNSFAVVNNISKESFQRLAGVVEDLESEHISDRESIDSKNQKIIRDIDNYFTTLDTVGKDSDIYFQYAPAKNLRSQIINNMLNPQSSKVARHLVGAKAWNVTIPDVNSKNADKIRNNFKAAVTQSFGFKIETKTPQQIEDRFEQLLANETVREGVEAVKEISKGNSTPKLEAALEAAVKLGGENLHSLDGILALVQYNPTESFTTNMGIEVDGVTNGIAIGLMQAPILPNMAHILKSVGIYLNGSNDANYPSWASNPLNRDLYKTLAGTWVNKLNEFKMDPKQLQQIELLESLIGKFITEEEFEGEVVGVVSKLGRDMSKDPLMTTGYGASINKIVDNLNKKFFVQINKKLKEASKLEDKKAVQLATKEIVESVFKIVGLQVPKGIDYSKPLEIEFDFRTQKLLTEVITDTYGETLKLALEESLGRFFEFRDTINRMTGAMFKVFEYKYNEKIKAETKAKGKVLTKEEEQVIFNSFRKYLPIIKSPFSKNLREGLLPIDFNTVREYSNLKDTVQAKVGKTKGLGKTVKGEDILSITGTVGYTAYAEPGARGLVLLTQAQDASIQAKSSYNHDSLDIFDAKVLSILDVDAATYETNQAFWDITTDYSVMDSTHAAFTRVVKLAAKEPALREVLLDSINGRRKDKITLIDFNREVLALKAEITQARKVIKETPNISINQYAHGADSAYRVNFEEETNIEDNLSEMLDEWIDSSKDIDEQSGSSINPIDFDNFNSVYDQNLSADNSLRIFEDMANFGNKVESPEHSAHLKEILTNVVNKVLRATDNIEFRVGETKGISYGAAKGEKVYINASTANRLNNNNELSLQEIQVHELLHTTLNYGIDNNFHLRQELKKIFRVVDKGIRDIHGDQGWKIFMNPNGLVQVDQAQEEAAAKERYDYIFNNTKVDVVQVTDPLTGKLTEKSTNNYLKEFVSFGLTNEAFLKVLAQIDTRAVTPTKGLPLKEKLTIWLNRLLDWVSGKLLHTRNLSADVALRNLVDHLAATTSKQRNAAIVQHDRARNINEFASRKIYQWMVKPLRDYAFDRAGRPKNIVGKIRTTIGLIPETFNNSQLRKNIKEVLRRIKVTEENFAIKLVREIQGTKTSNIAWHTLLRQSKHLIDSARKAASVDIQRYLRDSFVAGLPSKEESYALTRVVLKGDMSVLMDKYNMDDLIGLLTNETTLSNAIKETQAELKVFGSNANYYMVQAAGLGRWIATGKKPNRLQALNAHNIANMYLDIRDDKSKVIGDVKVAEEIIDRLATLYSFQSMTKDNKALVADVMMRENKANNQDNGIISLLNVQRDFKKKALADLFKNNKIQTIKGYTHETFNPRTDIKIATIREEAELLRSGYVRSKDPLETDSKNPNQTQNYMYILKDAAGVQYNKSIVSLTNKLARGTTLLDGHVSAGSLTPKAEAIRDVKVYIQKTKGDVHRQFTNPGSIPVTDEEILIPILDDRGNITELRHTMSEFHKITLLERDDRFEVVMGNMYGSIKDKVNSKQVNRKVVEMAYEDFQKGFTDEPNAFVKISPKSSEKRYKELFDLLPDDMRKDIQTVWGGKEITIRRELADLIFGYRQWSITHLFKDSTNPALDKINRALQHHKVRHIEAIWQEIVKLAKTNIVIRTPAVLIGNFVSNAILSVVKGVPISYMMKNQALALRALHNYQDDLHKRNALQLRLDSTPNLTDAQKKNLKVSINRLNDDLTNNPVSKLIDEGVFQAITEDLEDSKSPYDYKDKVLSDLKLARFLSEDTPLTRDVVQQAFMTEETTIFKLLMKGTQYSDFIARFALHKFNTEERLIIGKDGKERRGMSEDESLTDVLETFINYDIPTSKELQYMNDMGFFMFTKFLLRIQKVIFNLLKDRPVSTAASVLIQQVLGDVPDILDTIGFDLSGRAGFFIGPLDTATNISGIENAMNLVGY